MPSTFSFQEEDGIRCWSVTGVQTCALPISPRGPSGQGSPAPGSGCQCSGRRMRRPARRRSEERRVGKGVESSGGGTNKKKKKKNRCASIEIQETSQPKNEKIDNAHACGSSE